MPIIRANDGRVTHVNVFTCPADRQQELVDSLTETIAAARQVPGWVSASLHKSLDGTRVVNYIQFADAEAAQAVTRHLLDGGFIQRNVAIGSVAPGQYEVVHVLSSEDEPS